MKCPRCSQEVPPYVNRCPVCGKDVGFPNVRAAGAAHEQAALAQREQEALRQASARNCLDNVEQFREAVKKSEAAVCCPLSEVKRLASSPNELYSSFYKSVLAGKRLPQANPIDDVRAAIDDLLFPYYREEIVFGALTLDGRGVTSYGHYSMVLSERAIEDRASVFEENSLVFVQRTATGISPPPPGYRATWKDRHRLAVAKLASRIELGTRPDEFPAILLWVGPPTREDDKFIEVHICGAIHQRAIERVVGPVERKKVNQIIQKSLREELAEIGIPLEIL